MSSDSAQQIMAKLKSASKLSADDALGLVNDVYANGIVSRAEAEALFRLNEQLILLDARWRSRYIEAVIDFLLTRQPPERWITEEEAEWLMAQVRRDGRVCSETEIDLLLNLLRKAEGAPVGLSRFTLQSLSEAIREEGRIGAENVERLREVLYAPAGMGAVWVTREEADMLFVLNDALARAANDKSWNELFARAIANHLMARVHPTPDNIADALSRERWLAQRGDIVAAIVKDVFGAFNYRGFFEKIFHDGAAAEAARTAAREAAAQKAAAITEAESDWFKRRLGWDKTITPSHKALSEFLRDLPPGPETCLAAAA